MKTLLLTALLVPQLVFAADNVGDLGKKRTQQFIDALMKVKQAETGKPLAKADQDANAKIFAELDEMFDWDYLINEPVRTRVDKFSAAEKTEFLKKFKEVIRLVAYPDSGSFFRKAKWKITDAKDVTADKVTVGIDAKKDDLETHVDLHYKLMGSSLKLYDASFDGDSLVKDYQNQMVRIVDKGGAKELIAKIDKRKSELEKPKK
jgi:ABC-type transporter MlaC component